MEDAGRVFAVMQANYGQRWTHKADAIPVWQEKLQAMDPADVMRAADKAIDLYEWPPTLGEFSGLVRETTPRLTGPSQEKMELADRVYCYTKAESKSNPKGNPHHINLPESIAQRRPQESAEEYERRIGDAITFAKYPKLQSDGRSLPGAYQR
jgi:hypothetical protein